MPEKLKKPLMLTSIGLFIGVASLTPGVSGSTVLVLIGIYSTLITAIRDFNLAVIVVLALGAFIGLFTFAHVIYFLLERFYHITYFVIIGLIISSALNIWPGISAGISGFYDIAIFADGFCLAVFFHGYTMTTRLKKTEHV